MKTKQRPISSEYARRRIRELNKIIDTYSGICDRMKREKDHLEKLAAYHKSGQLQQRPPFIPMLVFLTETVRGDAPVSSHVFAPPGGYACHCNQWGAVSVRATDGSWLGVRLHEFTVTQWEANPHIALAAKSEAKCSP